MVIFSHKYAEFESNHKMGQVRVSKTLARTHTHMHREEGGERPSRPRGVGVVRAGFEIEARRRILKLALRGVVVGAGQVVVKAVFLHRKAMSRVKNISTGMLL